MLKALIWVIGISLVSTGCVEKKKASQVEQVTPSVSENSGRRRSSSHSGSGVYHTVKKGQTFWRICRTYGVDIDTVARANKIKDATQIEVGQKIWIPGAKKVLDVDVYQTPSGSGSGSNGAPVSNPHPSSGGDVPAIKGLFTWPVPDVHDISSPYGMRNGKMHEGVDFAAPTGTEIMAADDGKVTFSDKLSGYGNVIIIKHAGKLQTVYAHNRINLVEQGDIVSRGQKIAEVGNSGRSTGPHLHFEVRVGSKPVNPAFYLP